MLCSRARPEQSSASTMLRHAHDFQERCHRRTTPSHGALTRAVLAPEQSEMRADALDFVCVTCRLCGPPSLSWQCWRGARHPQGRNVTRACLEGDTVGDPIVILPELMYRPLSPPAPAPRPFFLAPGTSRENWHENVCVCGGEVIVGGPIANPPEPMCRPFAPARPGPPPPPIAL